MADNISQPTILVKKSDGTTERITLAELKKRQSKPSEPAVSLKQSDVKPLLEEHVPDSPHASTTTASDRLDQVSKIISSLSFTVPSQYENRLRSSIQLRLKDIRSEADTLDLCLRSIKDGGLGLTETQAQEIVSQSKPVALKMDKKLTPASGIEMATPISIPKKIEKEEVIEKIINQSAPTPEISDLIPASAPLRRSTSQNLSKPQMHDVKSKPTSLSPLEEIQFFSLVDLRRLASKPTEAVSRLKQKFVNLKEESFILFMDSWSAWRSSPLYQSYIQAVDEAVTRKVRLSVVTNAKEKISLPEMEELIKMEKELEI